jgi:hypothetical protein
VSFGRPSRLPGGRSCRIFIIRIFIMTGACEFVEYAIGTIAAVAFSFSGPGPAPAR